MCALDFGGETDHTAADFAFAVAEERKPFRDTTWRIARGRFLWDYVDVGRYLPSVELRCLFAFATPL